MGSLIRGVLETANVSIEPDAKEEGSIRAPVFILIQDLYPYLPIETAMSNVGLAVLATAARIADDHPDMALTLVHAVSSRRTKALGLEPDPLEDDDDDGDAVFFLSNAGCCQLSAGERESLLRVCLINFDPIQSTEAELSRLAVAAKCAPFLALAPGERTEDKSFTSLFKEVSKWLLRLLGSLGGANTSGVNNDAVTSSVVFSLVLESFALMSLASFDRLKDASVVKSALAKARPVAEKHVLSNAGSLWAVKSVASFIEALQQVELLLNDDADAVFEALIPNLRERYHFHRLHSLRILSHYPIRPFVTDFADLDLTGDLDEEQDSSPGQGQGPAAKSVGPSGPCGIIQILLGIESTPISFSKERYLLSLVSRVEVFGRTGRLPVVYAEAASSHMLGLLNVKFSPVWAGAVKSLVALTKGHEDSVWPPVQGKIAELMQLSYGATKTTTQLDSSAQVAFEPIGYLRACVSWETSAGKDTSLFQGAVATAKEQGRISRHASADEATVLESVWSVIEGAPQLLMRHSRVMVPIFLRFMVSQYYATHPNDPDARELRLEEDFPVDEEE
jgi:hypothetical protein